MIASNYIANWNEVVAHVLAEYPKEACGIVTFENIFIPYPNVAIDPLKQFQISPTVYFEHDDFKAVIHSHPFDPLSEDRYARAKAAQPSYADQEGQIATGVEWGIILTDGEACEPPIWWGDYTHRPDLFDREFITGAQDCLTFIADWMHTNLDIDLPYCAHDEAWFLNGLDYMSDLYIKWGFRDINTEEVQVGDLVMFVIRSKVVNHLGIYVGDGQVAHHLRGRFPTIEPIAKWKGSIKRIARHEKNNSALRSSS